MKNLKVTQGNGDRGLEETHNEIEQLTGLKVNHDETENNEEASSSTAYIATMTNGKQLYLATYTDDTESEVQFEKVDSIF